MPVPLLSLVIQDGLSAIPFAIPILKTLPCLVLVYIIKLFFGGPRNTSERLLHSKVIMITGGTSGIGASIAHSLASRGAQLVLLTHDPPSDPFVVDYVNDLRLSTSNDLIYAEQADLSSLHSIRLFATKWIDNAPPRRLDMVILCAATMTPRYGKPQRTFDGLEPCWGVNYLANFHLLSLLSPAIRAQPADRDVRIIFATCAAYIAGDVNKLMNTKDPLPKRREYGSSKLALMMFARAFQKHLDVYERPDKAPNNARVVLVDPGLTRTPGMRRWLSMGTLWGLMLYLFSWPLWWLVLKSADQAAQGFLWAAMEEALGRGPGGKFVRGVMEVRPERVDIEDEKIASDLWRFSETMVEALEKEGALMKAREKKEKEALEKAGKGAEVRKEYVAAMDGNETPATTSRRNRKAG